MIELISRRWWLITLRGVLAVVFGAFAIGWPGVTVLALVVLWGCYAIVDGLSAATIGLLDRAAPSAYRWTHVVLGAVGIGAGLISVLWPQITALALLVIIGTWAVLAGILQIAAAIRLRKVIDNELFLALAGAVCVVLGLLLLVQPTTGAIALVIAIATFALVWGIALILLGLRLRTLGRQVATV